MRPPSRFQLIVFGYFDFTQFLQTFNVSCYRGHAPRSLSITEIRRDAGEEFSRIFFESRLFPTIVGHPIYSCVDFNSLPDGPWGHEAHFLGGPQDGLKAFVPVDRGRVYFPENLVEVGFGYAIPAEPRRRSVYANQFDHSPDYLFQGYE